MYVASNGTKTAVILQDTDPQNPRDPARQASQADNKTQPGHEQGR